MPVRELISAHKPRPWNWSVGLLAPEWQAIAKGLICVLPFWEGAGDAYDLTEGIVGVDNGVGAWGVTPYGIAPDTGITAKHFNLGRPTKLDTLSFNVTCCVGCIPDSDPSPVGDRGYLYASRNDWSLYIRETGGPTHTIRGACRTNELTGLDVTSLVDGFRRFDIAQTYDGVTHAIYVDGVLDASTSESGDLGVDQDWTVTNHKANDDDVFGGRTLYFYVWNRTLSPEEILKVSRDPYGLIRRATYPVWKAPAAGGDQSIDPSPVAIDLSTPTQVISGSGSASISPGATSVNLSMPAQTISGSGSAPVSPSPVAIVLAVVSPSIAGTGSAPVSPDALSIPLTIASPTIAGSGVASISPGALSIPMNVVAPEISAVTGITLDDAVSIALSVVAPTIAGSGAASISPNALSVALSIAAQTIAGSGSAPVSPGAVSIVLAVVAPEISAGLGIPVGEPTLAVVTNDGKALAIITNNQDAIAMITNDGDAVAEITYG